MPSTADAVAGHYGRGDILPSILAALRRSGGDAERVAPAELAAVDEFHLRGRDASVELARRARLDAGQRVLDVGCGLGGSARLAAELGCSVTGIDLTDEYVVAARELTRLAGLQDRVEFRTASALSLPFADASFDVVWTEHAQMNIADKRAFYAGIARVLRPGGRLAFHDIFAGPAGAPHYPVPWADDPAISFLAPPHEVRALLEQLGLRVRDWDDQSAASAQWLAERLGRPAPPLGLHLLMGSNARTKFENMLRNLREQRIAVVQAVLHREGESAR